MSNNNPYATPEADVAVPNNNQGVAKIKAFKRFSTWWVVLLAIITLGIYAYYWMVSRTKTLNSIIPENKVPMWLPYTVIAFGVVNLLLTFAPMMVPEAAALAAISLPFSLIAMVLSLVWVYKFRNRLNIISGSEKGDVFRLGPILTFFFQLYYLQYKINQMHDASK